MTLAAFAPAKVNLFLHVGRPGAGGMHPLESLVAFADIGDVVTAEPAEDLTLALTGPFAAALAGNEVENLALRAAKALRALSGRPLGARLTLEKRLPIASGIGGGSADAAATLRVLDALWGLRTPALELAALAADLGADVPACLASRPALMTGYGERVRAVAMAPLAAVLVNPGAPAPTGAVYRAFDARADFGSDLVDPAHTPALPSLGPDPIEALARMRNDLTQAAIAIAPAIAEALKALQAQRGARLARLSGSGATVFGLFDGADAAEAAARALRAAHPRWWVCAARLGAPDITLRAA